MQFEKIIGRDMLKGVKGKFIEDKAICRLTFKTAQSKAIRKCTENILSINAHQDIGHRHRYSPKKWREDRNDLNSTILLSKASQTSELGLIT